MEVRICGEHLTQAPRGHDQVDQTAAGLIRYLARRPWARRRL